jgi:hypothetical protein
MSKLEKVQAKFWQFRQFLQVPTSLPADEVRDERLRDEHHII